MDGVKEEQRPDPFVKILALPAESVQPGAGFNQFGQRELSTGGVERPVADCGIGRGDDAN